MRTSQIASFNSALFRRLVLAVAAVPLATFAAIPDAPAPIREYSLLAGDKLRPKLAWVSDRDVLATALIDRMSNFWETQVVRVDARTGEMTQVMRDASVLCASAASGVAALLVGDKAGMFTGGTSIPPPKAVLFDWDRTARTLREGKADTPFSPWICRPTAPEHRARPEAGQQAGVHYLEPRHGQVQTRPDAPGVKSVSLVRAGRTTPLAVTPQEAGDPPEYLSFRDAYLLRPGMTLANTFFRDDKGDAQQELPVITMTAQGKVQREHFRTVLLKHGLRQDASLRPYAKGLLVISHGWRHLGGGIYTLSGTGGDTLRRVWCLPENAEDEKDGKRMCKVDEFALSPDGCRLAFYAEGSDKLATPIEARPTLKIMELCGR